MANLWFKFYGGEFLSDPKVLQLTGNERSCWLTLLCLASQNEGGEIKFLSEKQLLIMSGVVEDINVLQKFEKLEMIQNCNGIVTLVNWEKRQMSESYTRVKNFRKRQLNENDTDRREEKRIEENRKEEERESYGEFKNVRLSIEEYKKLSEKIGEKNTKILIEELSGYLASTKKKYLSHYATLLNWARRKFQEHQRSQSNQRKLV